MNQSLRLSRPSSPSVQRKAPRYESIVVIDDDVDLLECLVLAFHTSFSEVADFFDPEKAKAHILSSTNPTIILSDYDIAPRRTGADIARETFEHRQEHNIPMIIHTGNGERERLAELDKLANEGLIHSGHIKTKGDIVAVINAIRTGAPIKHLL